MSRFSEPESSRLSLLDEPCGRWLFAAVRTAVSFSPMPLPMLPLLGRSCQARHAPGVGHSVCGLEA